MKGVYDCSPTNWTFEEAGVESIVRHELLLFKSSWWSRSSRFCRIFWFRNNEDCPWCGIILLLPKLRFHSEKWFIHTIDIIQTDDAIRNIEMKWKNLTWIRTFNIYVFNLFSWVVSSKYYSSTMWCVFVFCVSLHDFVTFWFTFQSSIIGSSCSMLRELSPLYGCDGLSVICSRFVSGPARGDDEFSQHGAAVVA